VTPRRRATCNDRDVRLPLVFLHNQSGEDVFRAMRALRATRRCEESVVLSLTLVHEIRTVVGLAEPHDDTVVLLRPEHVKPPRVPSRWSRFARTFGCFL